MPLSKARNRERMRKTRLHKRLLPLMERKSVQPKEGWHPPCQGEIDADGNRVYEEW